MAHHQPNKTVRWVDGHGLNVAHEPPAQYDNNFDAASWSSASDSGATATTTARASTPRPTNNKVYAVSEGASGSGSGAPGNMYRLPVVTQHPHAEAKPSLHPCLEKYPHPLDVRGEWQRAFGLGDQVLECAFLNCSPPVMVFRFDLPEGLSWRHFLAPRSHGEGRRRGHYISVEDVLTAIWWSVREQRPLNPAHPLFRHAELAMRARGGQHFRRLDFFELWEGHLYFAGLEPQLGPAGWEFAVRLVPRLPPA